jgi:hypothetical protein
MGKLGSGLAWSRQAGLETGEPNLGLAPADLESCATTKVIHPTDLAAIAMKPKLTLCLVLIASHLAANAQAARTAALVEGNTELAIALADSHKAHEPPRKP